MIEITDLSKNYNGLLALDKLTLSMPENSIFGFVGPNGAGKSTTLNILTGIILPTSGEVKILGYDLKKESIDIKKRIGVIPEILALFDGLTGEEHLTFVGKVYGVKKNILPDRIKELLDFFDLTSAKDRLIETYSQGMRKKLAFAASIIHSPHVLFLDEPFENVDPISRKKMKGVLNKFKDRGKTVMITSHSLIELEDLCDVVAIINKGKIVFQSATKDIRSKIKNEITKETYQSLEEIFLDVTKNDEIGTEKDLSWL
ncbi:MAG: ABC transporter ATP-binding protein [Ignavibacteriaceae bacterium]